MRYSLNTSQFLKKFTICYLDRLKSIFVFHKVFRLLYLFLDQFQFKDSAGKHSQDQLLPVMWGPNKAWDTWWWRKGQSYLHLLWEDYLWESKNGKIFIKLHCLCLRADSQTKCRLIIVLPQVTLIGDLVVCYIKLHLVPFDAGMTTISYANLWGANGHPNCL